MLEPLTTLVIKPKLGPYLGGLLRYVCIYGVYLHLAVFICGSSTLIFTSPIFCAIPREAPFTQEFVNSRCANKDLLDLEQTELKEIAIKKEKAQKELMEKQQKAGRHGGGGRKNTPLLYVPGNNDDTSKMVSYYR